MKFDSEGIFKLLEDYCFSSDFSQADVDCFLDAINAKENKIDFEYGATKLVIWKGEWDFVIKIPFTGSTDDCYGSYEEFNCAWNEKASDLALGNGYDPNKLRDWDYCEAELHMYMAAKALGIEKYFAEIQFLGMTDYGAHPIYIQEKCDIGPHTCRSGEERDSFENDSHCKGMIFYGNTEWAMDLYDYIANEELYKIIVNIFNRILYICDLHNGNIGYRKEDDCPVLVDYAGFHD